MGGHVLQNNKKNKKRRRNKGGKNRAANTLLPIELTADSQKMERDLDEKKKCSSPPTQTSAVDCRESQTPSSEPINAEEVSRKSRLIVLDEQHEKDSEFLDWHVVENDGKPRARRPDGVPSAKGLLF